MKKFIFVLIAVSVILMACSNEGNWLFSGSPTGAETSSKVYTLVETAKHCNVNLHDYLRIVFEKAPHAENDEDWSKLLPWNFLQPDG